MDQTWANEADFLSVSTVQVDMTTGAVHHNDDVLAKFAILDFTPSSAGSNFFQYVVLCPFSSPRLLSPSADTFISRANSIIYYGGNLDAEDILHSLASFIRINSDDATNLRSLSQRYYTNITTQVAPSNSSDTKTTAGTRQTLQRIYLQGTVSAPIAEDSSSLAGPITGGIFGGLGVLIIVALVIWRIRRYRARQISMRQFAERRAQAMAVLMQSISSKNTHQLDTEHLRCLKTYTLTPKAPEKSGVNDSTSAVQPVAGSVNTPKVHSPDTVSSNTPSSKTWWGSTLWSKGWETMGTFHKRIRQAKNGEAKGSDAPTTESLAMAPLHSGDVCPICLDDMTFGERVRVLPCDHIFHPTCVDPWLVKKSALCPL
ncbi:hypothetical protein IWQ62_004216, partial [Dispira parvispora]